ncbi:hypothetical protein CO731_03712 [Aminobacter sp. MSH1]|nr:hypothetical protein CO731_03712 [Aminobacter sp. MSH1]
MLGLNRGHYPRHTKVYRNLAAEHDRIQQERIAAFTEFAADIAGGAYPDASRKVGIDSAEMRRFEDFLSGQT